MAGHALSRLAFTGLVAVSICQPALPSAQPADSAPAYIERGHQTEARRRAYHDRMDHLHDAIADALRQTAPDLLQKLEPAPPKTFGYSILPRITTDPPPKPPVKPEVVRFSWVWSDTLIARENAALDTLEKNLEQIRTASPADRRAAYEKVVADYKTRVDRRRTIDADVDYNWLWQKQIAANRPLFDRLQARLEAEERRLAQSESTAQHLTQPVFNFDPSPFVQLETPGAHEHVVRVAFYTDIMDSALVEAFVRAVETYWQAHSGEERYRARLTVTTITPAELYCGRHSPSPAAAPSCTPPATGDKIDLAAHVRRFPDHAAALTTGATTVQITGGRALVLGPHDVSPRTLAHEFGHLLGLPDTYSRGYRDLGIDGFQVLELVADQADLMSSISTGSIVTAHFKGLIAAREIQQEMQAGLTALYQGNDPAAAVSHFHAVLARNPEHFGATLQLAKALDQAGQVEEAVIVWKRVLEMAEAARNVDTAAIARARLAGR
jgi:tetratricopeptide (TPR) repeat protein